MPKYDRETRCGLYSILVGIVLVALWLVAEAGVWWFFGPETFWQRVFCFIILQVPFGVLFGLLCVGLFAFSIEYIDQNVTDDPPPEPVGEEQTDHEATMFVGDDENDSQ